MIDAVTRTPEEIVARILERTPSDFFGAETSRLVAALPWEQAAPLLSDEARRKYETGKETWRARTHPAQAILLYLPFAIGKADDHRGLSANRSIDHMRGLTWLLGLDGEVDWNDYENYGAPILSKIAGLLGAAGMDVWTKHVTPGVKRMAQNLPCQPGCESGCGG